MTNASEGLCYALLTALAMHSASCGFPEAGRAPAQRQMQGAGEKLRVDPIVATQCQPHITAMLKMYATRCKYHKERKFSRCEIALEAFDSP
jgi:hypothetical protein